MLSLSIKPEYLFTFDSYRVYNTLLTSLAVSSLLIIGSLVIFATRRIRGAVSNLPRVFVRGTLSFIDTVTGDPAVSKKLFPLIATLFLYIVFANIAELVPGFLGSMYMVVGGRKVPVFRSPSSDLNTTIALALVSVIITQGIVIHTIGLRKYIRKFVDLRSPMRFVVGVFELTSEVMKLVSFSFRLFGNMFAGEVLLLVAAYFLPLLLPVPFMALEVFVGFIQAFIFAMLTLAFIRMGKLETDMATQKEVG